MKLVLMAGEVDINEIKKVFHNRMHELNQPA